MDAKKLLEAQYDVLGHEGKGFTEIRVFEGPQYFCKDKEEFVRRGLEVRHVDSYVGVNPRSVEKGDADSIKWVTSLFVDIDPVRPKNTGSSDEQLSQGIVLGQRIKEDFGSGVVVCSGSGSHVFFPIQPISVENKEVLSDSLRAWNKTIKETYGTKDLKIDAVWDLPRVCRLWSSHNSRSNRICRPIGDVGPIERVSYAFNQTAQVKAPAIKATSSEVEQRFHRLVKSNKRLKDFVEGVVSLESPSDYDFEFVITLAKAQFSQQDVKELWKYNEKGNKEPKKGDIERVFSKAVMDVNSFSLAQGAKDYFKTLKDRRMGIRTGFNTLDEMISGLKDGKLILIGARPGTGKTTLVTQILSNISEQGIPTLFFPTEVGAEPIVDKIIARKCEIPLKKFQNGTFSEEDVSKIEESQAYIRSLPLVIYEDFGLNIDKYEEQIDKHAPKIVCLDYFQALKWNDPASLGEKEEAVRRIKKITKDRGITTLCLSQLNRGSQGSSGKASLSELKGTATLEELGDVVVQMYASDEIIQDPKVIDLVVTKSKYSATGSVILNFKKTYGKFTEAEVQNGG